jgi:hypothetical protein
VIRDGGGAKTAEHRYGGAGGLSVRYAAVFGLFQRRHRKSPECFLPDRQLQ